MTSWEKGGENIDEVFGGVDGGRGNGIEGLAALFQQDSTGHADGEAGREVLPGIGHGASELNGAPIPAIAQGGEDCLPCAGEQFQGVELNAQLELSGERAIVSHAHAALDAGNVCGFDHHICKREASFRPFEIGAEYL